MAELSTGDSKRILLIQPRWLSGQALHGEWRLATHSFPDAHVTLLAETAPDETFQSLFPEVEWIALPDLWSSPRGQMRATIRRVRAHRFAAALVLSGPRCLLIGCYELMFWAVIARTSRRFLSDGTPFSRMRPCWGLVRRVLRHGWGQTLLRILKRRPLVATPHSSEIACYRRRLLTQLYLHYHDELCGTRRGALHVADEAIWDRDLACQAGWETANTTAEWIIARRVPPQLEASLLLLQGATIEEIAAAQTSGWQTVRDDESLLDGALRDVWLKR